jgi:hypothetical protein
MTRTLSYLVLAAQVLDYVHVNCLLFLVNTAFIKRHLNTSSIHTNFNSNPGGYLFRTLPGGIKFILTSIFEQRGCKEWAHMCRFYFCEMIGPVYFYCWFVQ